MAQEIGRHKVSESSGCFDYVIVGAGSAGAIIASRLAENPGHKVLLVEAGPLDRHPMLRIPAAMRYAYNAPRYNWNYLTEAEPFLGNRRLVQPRGKVLGGSSSINGQIYLRGHPLDYEGWSEAGAKGWSYADVLPYFRKLESVQGVRSEYRGEHGPVQVRNVEPGPLERAFLNAGKQAGYRQTEDVNGYQQDGFGILEKNIGDGLRSSTARCYLRNPPDNLRILTGSTARRIMFEARRANGIIYARGGKEFVAQATRSVVLCAGAFNSPFLLMHSGLGPASQLRANGIGVLQDLPGVGTNLMDHPLSAVQVACSSPVTLYRYLSLPSRLFGLAKWLFTRKGFLANNHFDVVAFLNTGPEVPFPNLQIALFAIAVAEGSADFVRQHAFQLQFSIQRPLSRGHVRLRGPDPFAPPSIVYNMLEHERDMKEMTAGFRLSRQLLLQPALARFAGKELIPGAEITTDDELEAWIRQYCHSSYHPCGTCRMGTDRLAVVDEACRVRGVEGLCVADASIMPVIPSANLNCPAMMIGEKAADHIAGKQLLNPEPLPFFREPTSSP